MEKHYDVKLNSDNKFDIYEVSTGDVFCTCDTVDKASQVARALELAYAMKIVMQLIF